MKKLVSLAAFVILVALVAIVGGLFGPGDWYAGLAKPPWNPPSSVFAPVWTVLYALIALAGWLAWQRRRHRERRAQAAFVFYGFQLVLNALWTVFFFGLQQPGAAFIDLVVLWIAVLSTLLLFYGIRPVAGLLLVPYFAWITFAARLNLAIWRLNA